MKAIGLTALAKLFFSIDEENWELTSNELAKSLLSQARGFMR